MESKLKTWSLRACLLGGLIGWPTAINAGLWLGRHDSGDPAQWVGSVLFGGTLLSFVTAFVGLIGLVRQAKLDPLRGKQWIAAVLGASYVAMLVFVFVVIRF